MSHVKSYCICVLLINKKIKDTKGEIRSRKSKKDRHCYDQRKRRKGKNNYIQNITQKTKDRVTWTHLKQGMNSCAPEG